MADGEIPLEREYCTKKDKRKYSLFISSNIEDIEEKCRKIDKSFVGNSRNKRTQKTDMGPEMWENDAGSFNSGLLKNKEEIICAIQKEIDQLIIDIEIMSKNL